MSAYLLDTNVVSELTKDPPAPQVLTLIILSEAYKEATTNGAPTEAGMEDVAGI